MLPVSRVSSPRMVISLSCDIQAIRWRVCVIFVLSYRYLSLPESSSRKANLTLEVNLMRIGVNSLCYCHTGLPQKAEDMCRLVLSALLGLSLGLVNAFPTQQTDGGKNWVVIVAGSNGWYNYRHQVRGVQQGNYTKLLPQSHLIMCKLCMTHFFPLIIHIGSDKTNFTFR